jgi:hypothetical protein
VPKISNFEYLHSAKFIFLVSLVLCHVNSTGGRRNSIRLVQPLSTRLFMCIEYIHMQPNNSFQINFSTVHQIFKITLLYFLTSKLLYFHAMKFHRLNTNGTRMNGRPVCTEECHCVDVNITECVLRKVSNFWNRFIWHSMWLAGFCEHHIETGFHDSWYFCTGYE